MGELIKVGETRVEKQKEVINTYDIFYTYSVPETGNPNTVEFSMNDPRGGLLYGTYSVDGNVSFNMSGISNPEAMITAILNTCSSIVTGNF